LIFAASGAKALAMLQKQRPDIILMDVNMLDLTGVDVTRCLKATDQFANIPVIMITARARRT
jgi:CheY-like chemotaxis protein